MAEVGISAIVIIMKVIVAVSNHVSFNDLELPAMTRVLKTASVRSMATYFI